MADDTVLGKAMALLPIGGKPAKKRPPTMADRRKQIADVQKKLAKLTRDVAALAKQFAPAPKTGSAHKRKPSTRTASGKSRRTTSAKRG